MADRVEPDAERDMGVRLARGHDRVDLGIGDDRRKMLRCDVGRTQDQPARDAFWSSLVNNQVEAMFSAHNHVYYRSQPTGKTWMVIAGNGGTPIDATVDQTIPSTGTYFGYTVVSVTNSGRVFSKSYGRDVPAATYAAAPVGATTLRDSIEITWK